MIDELIPDLENPRLRRLYDALLGRREPTDDEKGVFIAVGCGIASGEHLAKVELVMERAWELDRDGMERRLRCWIEDAKREHA